MEKLDPAIQKTQVLILVPTRELALQTSSVLKKLSKHIGSVHGGVSIVCTTGGTDLKEDIIRLMQPVSAHAALLHSALAATYPRHLAVHSDAVRSVCVVPLIALCAVCRLK